MRFLKLITVLCCLALVTTACGSRAEDTAENDNGLTPTTAGTGTETTGPDAAAPNMVGTHEVKCGEGDGNNTVPPEGEFPDDTKGVTADSINIGLITDKAGTVKLPTKGIEEGAQAFVEFCNGLGGINGRELKLKVYDSAISRHAEVTKQACDDDIFAIVMSGSVLETGAQQMVDCKLVEVPAYTASASKSLSDRLIQPLPAPADQLNTGMCRFMADEFPDAYANAASIYTGLPAAENRAKAFMEACEPLGYNVVYDKPIKVGETGWGPIVSEMKAKGVKYLTMVSASTETIGLLKAMSDQNFEPEVIDLGQQYYDPEISAAAGADGAYVLTNTTPFEDADSSPALQKFLELHQAVTDKEPTSLGVQAFSAGMLFAELVAGMGNDISRENLLAAGEDIDSWDGGGLHFQTNPAANTASTCFMYMQVVDGEFVRAYPDEGFSCDPEWVVDLKGDFGTGATEGAG